MSKSDVSDLSRINLKDDKVSISNKIKKAKTDQYPIPNDIKELEDRPEAKNLLGIYSSLKIKQLKTLEEFEEKIS